MTPEELTSLVSAITTAVSGRPLDADLQQFLNAEFPPDSEAFASLAAACRDAVEAGWMCNREAGGIRFGRVLKPSDQTHGFSVDVVRMEDVTGPHHRHPNGEIDMVMPISGNPAFDGQGAGWKVYEPDSAHHPVVEGGAAFVLYLLPDGAIEFTGK